MNKRHRNMLDLLAGIREKAAQRDELMVKLEYAINHDIQKDIDRENGVTDVEGKNHDFHTTFSMARYESLKKHHAKAVKDGEETFEFEGRVLFIGYAEHVLAFMAKHFERRR